MTAAEQIGEQAGCTDVRDMLYVQRVTGQMKFWTTATYRYGGLLYSLRQSSAMRRHTSLMRLGCLLALWASACSRGEVPADTGSDADAYVAVLAALRDSLGTGVRVQSHAIFVKGYTSAPGDMPEHFGPNTSAAIVQAVEESAPDWYLCEAVGADCLTEGSGAVLALSELGRRGQEADVWVTFAQIHPTTSPTSWEILYYKVALRWSDGRWHAEGLALLGGEP